MVGGAGSAEGFRLERERSQVVGEEQTGFPTRASAHLSVNIKGLRESPSTNKGESEGFPGALGTALEAQCLPLFPTVASY